MKLECKGRSTLEQCFVENVYGILHQRAIYFTLELQPFLIVLTYVGELYVESSELQAVSISSDVSSSLYSEK